MKLAGRPVPAAWRWSKMGVVSPPLLESSDVAVVVVAVKPFVAFAGEAEDEKRLEKEKPWDISPAHTLQRPLRTRPPAMGPGGDLGGGGRVASTGRLSCAQNPSRDGKKDDEKVGPKFGAATKIGSAPPFWKRANVGPCMRCRPPPASRLGRPGLSYDPSGPAMRSTSDSALEPYSVSRPRKGPHCRVLLFFFSHHSRRICFVEFLIQFLESWRGEVHPSQRHECYRPRPSGRL